MVQIGKKNLKETGASKILIMIVKGSESSKNKAENPLNEKEQVELIFSIYRNDPQVEIYKKFPSSSFIGDIIEHVASSGYVVAGWLAGSDRFSDYKKMLRSFNAAKFKETHDYSPILFDSQGNAIVKMIETPRLMSGTRSRQLATEVDFQTWVAEVVPSQVDETALRVYKTTYEKLRGDMLEEMSAMGGANIQGFSGAKNMDREKFLEELKLRKFIKSSIRLQESKKKVENRERLKEETKLRSIIRSLIKESEEDHPHHSTGINVLSDLLKKIVPVIEIDYKKMTSNPVQRQSFRAHILKASQNALATEKAEDKIDSGQEGVPDEDLAEAEINLDVGGDNEQNLMSPEDKKFIDIERPSQKKAKQSKPDPLEQFGIQGEDETGRNIALTTFQKVEKVIIESYSILSDQDDKRLFYDYLITNLKLYFDKFEDELKSTVQEPTSDTYEQEKDQVDAPQSSDLQV